MGGNALKHLGVIRVDTRTVINVFNRLSRFMSIYPVDLYLVPWIEEKDDHGDIDVLVTHDLVEGIQFVLERYGISRDHMIHNGDVLSAAIPVDGGLVQVDFISVSPKNLPFTKFYYSGGDFGSLIGRVAAANGYTFATDGFRVRAAPEDGIDEDIPLPVSIKDTLNLLGYSYFLPDTFLTYENMWKYVMSSTMVLPSMFLPAATNAENRSRDKQRASIVRFQEWIHTTYPEMPLFNKKISGHGRIMMLPGPLREFVDDVLRKRKNEKEIRAEMVGAFGRKAVEHVFGDIPSETIGNIIRNMQPMLPSKDMRIQMWDTDRQNARLLGEVAARAAGLELGVKPK